jgi:hypothetical protein
LINGFINLRQSKYGFGDFFCLGASLQNKKTKKNKNYKILIE